MTEKRIIAIAGATGAQGGSLARAILADTTSDFAVRALTRDAGSDKAKELEALGAEVVQANLDDAESVKKAFAGAYGAFCVTFFWAHVSPDIEGAQARTMAEAAKGAGLRHVIWSTLEDTRHWIPLSDKRMPTLMEKYKVPHFDSKGQMDAVFDELGVPTTYLQASFYWENFIHFGLGPKKSGDGALMLTLPIADKKMAGIAAEDIGKCAYGVFKLGVEVVGHRIGVAGAQLTGEEMAAKMSRALGQQVVFNAVSPDAFRAFGFPGAEDLGNMFQFYAEFEEVVNASRNVEKSRTLNPELQSFDQWLDSNAKSIPLE
ncbi:MAG: NmrA/HSCARG family protein [Gemmatimonadaceae bacterium]|nr:NmrA/HSCARG family protein [Gemmatimonadaceae bacterium]